MQTQFQHVIPRVRIKDTGTRRRAIVRGLACRPGRRHARPILKNLRGAEDRPPPPEQILDLKVCDPAMGSGAFLVEACRRLGDAHGDVPEIPPDEDEVVFARRLIAQRCLYGCR